MNASQLAADWDKIKRRLPLNWDHLTEQDILFIGGSWRLLVEALQARYGLSLREAERALREYSP